ncbi:MAG TPA: hypothetical protein VGM39_13730 [Kofleriaceae bacterium]|jgi:hypothetical protein
MSDEQDDTVLTNFEASEMMFTLRLVDGVILQEINGKLVKADQYDRALASARTAALADIAQSLDQIHDAMNENKDGEHRVSIASALLEVADSIDKK